MLKSLHFLLTYKCTMECDHCFVYSGPYANGTFSLKRIRMVLDEAVKIGTIESVYFEGGEPFMFYPIMLEGIRLATEMGFQVGIVTNSYWATTSEDAELWLKPFVELGVTDISLSDDAIHFDDENDNFAKNAFAAAKGLGLPVGAICIEKPSVVMKCDRQKGEPVVGSDVLLKGRAVEKLSEGLPMQRFDKFTECKDEELREPQRVHLDPYGYVHLCQGLVMGNFLDTPLSGLVQNYNADSHPICGPLLEGGPARLAQKYNIQHEDEYVSACHFCYLVRLALMKKFPQYLAPRQVYGLEQCE